MTTGRELEANLSTLLGLNNRRPDFRLRTKDGVFVRAVSNTDISDAGTAKRRQGYTQVFAGTNCHSFWADDDTDRGYFVDGNTLYRSAVAGAGMSAVALSTTMLRDRHLTYTKVGDEVMLSDGVRNLAVSDAGVVRPLGATPLAAAPFVTVGAGALPQGSYQVCCAFMNSGREISPTTVATQINLPANGALVIAGLPTTWPTDAAQLLIYVSPPNGDTMYLEQRLQAPAASATVSSAAFDGQEVSTYLRAPMPPGRIMRWHAGRLYVADGAVLRYSDVYQPGLYQPTMNFTQFPQPITVVEPCDTGMFIVADKTYWLVGDIVSAELKTVSPTRGVFGTGSQDQRLLQVFWMTEQGFAIGTPDGAVALPQAENVAVNRAAAGATLYREADGQRQLVSALFGTENTATAARSYMNAEVIRKGTTK